MEDVVEIKIEYEPTQPTAEDDPKSQRHGGEDDAGNATAKRGGSPTRGSDASADAGPVSAAWAAEPRAEDNGKDGAPVPGAKVPERALHAQKSVAFFAVFDGHGGREAAQFAREHLWDLLKRQRGFWSGDHSEVCAALRKGFIACHHAMWKELRKYAPRPRWLRPEINVAAIRA